MRPTPIIIKIDHNKIEKISRKEEKKKMKKNEKVDDFKLNSIRSFKL